jgi:heptosyltransferase-1
MPDSTGILPAAASMRILLVKTSSLGDVVHNLPVVTDLARRRPDAVIDWVVEESFAELPRLHPAVGRVIPVAVRRWRRHVLSPDTWRQMGDFREYLRETDYDLVLDTQGLLKSALITRQARLTDGGRRCGQDAASAREPLAARFYDQCWPVPRDLHAVERNRRLASLAIGAVEPLPLDYGIQAPPLAAEWLPRGGYSVLLTATSRRDKEWPEPDWLALGSALIATGLRCVLPGGSAPERERAARLAAGLGRGGGGAPRGGARGGGVGGGGGRWRHRP